MQTLVFLVYSAASGFYVFLVSFQTMCWLSFTWHSLYVDWLYHLLRKLWKHSNWMWMPRRCWWSRTAVIIYNGLDCSWFVHSDWYILQCLGGYHGWTTNMATTLSHTREKNANKGELVDLFLAAHVHNFQTLARRVNTWIWLLFCTLD